MGWALPVLPCSTEVPLGHGGPPPHVPFALCQMWHSIIEWLSLEGTLKITQFQHAAVAPQQLELPRAHLSQLWAPPGWDTVLVSLSPEWLC